MGLRPMRTALAPSAVLALSFVVARGAGQSRPREAEPGPSAMTLTDIARGAFFHGELRVCGGDGPKRDPQRAEREHAGPKGSRYS